MFLKVGELEHPCMDKDFKEIVLKIMSQNQSIIEMNKMLMESLAKPILYMPLDKGD
jgi:hypothetical protein